MYRADLSIDVLKYFGIWCPTHFLNGSQLIYSAFTIVMVSTIYIFNISTFLYLFLVKSNLDDITETLFYVLAVSCACVKIATVLFKRDKIIKLRNFLLYKKCCPQDEIEYYIQDKFDNVGRKVSIIIISFASIVTILNATTPLMKGLHSKLPFKSWIPYNLENQIIFWLTCLIQAVGVTIAGHVSIAVDTFIMVMMLQLCAQLEILMHRIKKYPQLSIAEQKIYYTPQKEQMVFGMWIQHHESIYRFGKNLNNIYNWVFFYQLCATTIDVCTSIYVLVKENLISTKYWRMVFTLSGIMLQICLYCCPGHMVMEKSKEIGYAIYSMDWIILPINSKRNLIHVMRRSERPLKFTAGNIFPITIETFTSILRMSFSIYNFLIQCA